MQDLYRHRSKAPLPVASLQHGAQEGLWQGQGAGGAQAPPPSPAATLTASPQVTVTPEQKAAAAEAKTAGNTAFSAGQFGEAVKHFSTAIENDPTDNIFFSNRRRAAARAGRAAPGRLALLGRCSAAFAEP